MIFIRKPRGSNGEENIRGFKWGQQTPSEIDAGQDPSLPMWKVAWSPCGDPGLASRVKFPTVDCGEFLNKTVLDRPAVYRSWRNQSVLDIYIIPRT